MSFSSLFQNEWKLIVYLTTMYVYCVNPAISKSPKQRPNYLRIAETSVVLIVFIGVIFDISTCIVSVYLLSLYMNQVPEMLYKVHD